MQEEIDALQMQGTWSLVPCPQQKNIVGSKWVYKIKRHENGSVARYKARLVAQGFSQELGLDFSKTFSPVVRHTTVRLILSLAAMHKWSLRQLNVKNAFLHGELEEEVFMRQPQGSNAKLVQTVIDDLGAVFEMKDMGRLTYFLGLQVSYNSTGDIFVHQHKYAKDLLQKAGLSNCRACPTRCKPHNQCMTAPTEIHFHLVKRILRYIQGTMNYGIHFTHGPWQLQAYSDVDWTVDLNTRRSTTGFVVLLGHNPISWQSKKQGSASRNSTEAEYRALAKTYSFCL
ncbi:hypothetical protein L3X38_015578 [Prunus dulcis]|uniref:Reverse transcriptase Ty1/copia-type domain-containing protein n=1 Tax=Prunus dulcis TaxID=3755 RepID=A0AAD4W4C6_PRUDU|nr:hypothetical protein L3X38_015578 [Prunus dulcis]